MRLKKKFSIIKKLKENLSNINVIFRTAEVFFIKNLLQFFIAFFLFNALIKIIYVNGFITT